MHKLLERQLRRHFGLPDAHPAELAPFIAAIDAAYREADDDRRLIEHSMHTVSVELADRYQRLNDALAATQESERRLTGALALLEATLESTTDGLMVVNTEGRMVRMNRKFIELWRLPEEIVQSGDDTRALEFVVAQLQEPDDFLNKVRELYANPEAESFDSLRFKDGRVYERYSVPQRLRGETVGRVWSFRDVTERLRLEEQLRQSQKMEAVGGLAAGIAHEINTPIQYIGDNIRFLDESYADVHRALDLYRELLEEAAAAPVSPERVAEIAAAIERADIPFILEEAPRASSQALDGVERVAEIVRALKEFSHPGTAQKIPTDLNRAIRSTTTVARNEWKYVADLQTELDPELPLVPCLPGEVNQAILNLVVNAAHAIADTQTAGSKERGVITLTTAVTGEWVEIRVRDTGTGIPEELRERIFDPFFTTKEVGRGTGQGLTFVHSIIVDKHNGTVTLESEIGKGTTFIVRLPHGGDSNAPEFCEAA